MVLQGSLFVAGDDVGTRPMEGPTDRRILAGGAWVDVWPGWVRGADALFERLIDVVPWRAERRPMYDRVVNVPRLQSFYDEDRPLPDTGLDVLRQVLDRRYGAELGEPFCTAGLCLYRNGQDSVAWHGDTIGRRRHPRHHGGHRLAGGDPTTAVAATVRRPLPSSSSWGVGICW